MKACNKTVTFLHLGAAGNEAQVVQGVSAVCTRGCAAESGGAVHENTLRLCIPASACGEALPAPGDLLLLGAQAAPATRTALRGQEVFTVQQVADHRCGRLSHLAVTAV